MDQPVFARAIKHLFPAALLALFVSGATGQVSGGGASPGGMNAALVKLLGTNNFTATANLTVKDASGTQILAGPMDFALLDGKVRVQIDQAQMKSKEMSPAAANSLMQLGLSRVISVIRPDKQAVYVIYPDRKAYVNLPFSKEDAQAAARVTKIQRTVITKETVDGHPCVKTKATVTAGMSQPIEAITWNATDMKDFPVQIQTTERGNTSVLLYRGIKFIRPDPRLFDAPVGFTSYAGAEELRQAIIGDMQKAGGQAPAPKTQTPTPAPRKQSPAQKK